ncbi:MAG TPA: YbaB/EbfC family nucleoid-associated protein [Gammaproteobacteria bacterium]|nr:YbaB/EbfC family nucleoid-associated protein [Gammaproteobacteria bacterium]
MSDADFQKIMQQAQKMQANIQKAQEEIVSLTVIGEAGGGLVKVKMNGRHDVLRFFIAPTLLGMSEEGKEEEEGEGGKGGKGLKPTIDKAMLEDLIAAAVNDAVRKVEKASREKMTGLMSGLNLPPEMSPFGGGGANQ